MMGDDVRHDEMAVDHTGQAHPATRQLRHQARIADKAQSQAAMLDRDGRAEKSQLAHRGDQSVRVFVAMLQLGGDGDDVAFDKAMHSLDNVTVQRLCHLAVPSTGRRKVIGAGRPWREINRTSRRAANRAGKASEMWPGSNGEPRTGWAKRQKPVRSDEALAVSEV